MEEEFDSVSTERRLMEERLETFSTVVKERRQKMVCLSQLVAAEKRLKQEYDVQELKIQLKEELIEAQEERNQLELDEQVHIFEQLVCEFKREEQDAIKEIENEVGKQVNRLMNEISALKERVEEESKQVESKLEEMAHSLDIKKAEKEQKMRVKEIELEIVVEELAKEVDGKGRFYDEDLEKDSDEMKKLEAEWMQKIEDIGKPRMNSPLETRDKSPEPDPCLNQISATGEVGEELRGRKKLPVSVAFTMDDDDEF